VNVWYHVRDLDAARDFYAKKLGFTETFVDEQGRWAKLERGAMEIGLAEGDPQDDGGVARRRLRAARRDEIARCLRPGRQPGSARTGTLKQAAPAARGTGAASTRVDYGVRTRTGGGAQSRGGDRSWTGRRRTFW
jgi:catechol 2,3-dioxygenase-like lactoylglutathione lyase family enzyme